MGKVRRCGLGVVLLGLLVGTAGCGPGLRLEVANDSGETVSIDVREGEADRLLDNAKSVLHTEVAANSGAYVELNSGSQGWSLFVNDQHVIGSDTWAYEVPVIQIHIRTDGTVGISQ
jgi:hypothetical protein